MQKNLFRKEDSQHIKGRGIPEEKILAQIEMFRRGIPCINLKRPCTIEDGIIRIEEHEFDELIKQHAEAATNGRITKFVPASGAATRMFRNLQALASKDGELTGESLTIQADNGDAAAVFGVKFFDNLQKFAFYERLKSIMSQQGINVDEILAKGEYKAILEYLLSAKGLNYGGLPKGLIPFHKYENHSRTPFEEHIVEAIAYAQDSDKTARIHFTVSEKHLSSIRDHIENISAPYEMDGIALDITYSIQKPSTDTIAVDLNNEPFRDEDGKLLFRPGGHGALLENLNDLEGDIVFIKNIDNVVPDSLKADTYLYKKILCGYLLGLQNNVFNYLKRLKGRDIDEGLIREIFTFAREKLSVTSPGDWESYSSAEKTDFLCSKLNRPLRVCGMVENVAEPGGGPFWVSHGDGSISLQIVESSQVDLKSENQRQIWNSATHFNPVDLVCGVRDYRGQFFNLMNFMDPEAGFIAVKSKYGRELKALELPGLWNGSMAWWNTAFIEVPITTFNPVKTVNDLLRETHR